MFLYNQSTSWFKFSICTYQKLHHPCPCTVWNYTVCYLLHRPKLLFVHSLWHNITTIAGIMRRCCGRLRWGNSTIYVWAFTHGDPVWVQPISLSLPLFTFALLIKVKHIIKKNNNNICEYDIVKKRGRKINKAHFTTQFSCVCSCQKKDCPASSLQY